MADLTMLITNEATVVGGIVDYIQEMNESIEQEKNEYNRAEEEAENVSVEVDNVYALRIPSQSDDGSLKDNQYSVYTSAQIQRMREEIAYVDADGDKDKFVENLMAMNREEPDISSGNFSTDHSRIISSDDTVNWIEKTNSSVIDASAEDNPAYNADCIQHAENGWIDANIGTAEHLDDGTLLVIANNWNVQPSTITNESSVEDIMKEYELIDGTRQNNALPDSTLSEMRAFVAEADEVSGNGTYEMNYQAMVDRSYKDDDVRMYADAGVTDSDVKTVQTGVTKQTDSRGTQAEKALGDTMENVNDIEEEDMELN